MPVTTRYLTPSRARSWLNRIQSIETAIAHKPSQRRIEWPV